VEALHPHQSLHSYDLVRGRDVFLVIATGSGKTLIILAPLIAAQACRKSGIALLLVPTKALGEEHKITAEKYSIVTWVINEDSLRDASANGRDLFKELFKATGIQLAIMSPQMAGCDSFKVHEDKFKHAVNWALIDEPHLAGSGSGVFEAPYQRLASLQWRLKTDVVWAAVTATATPADVRYISRLLGFADTHVHTWYSVDRSNIKYIPRFF
ncbi:P-loop containing nucleoside triphosphate hydrolase protein, partial [Mucidula mucida]